MVRPIADGDTSAERSAVVGCREVATDGRRDQRRGAACEKTAAVGISGRAVDRVVADEARRQRRVARDADATAVPRAAGRADGGAAFGYFDVAEIDAAVALEASAVAVGKTVLQFDSGDCQRAGRARGVARH